MNEKVDYIVHEGMMARQERTIKRLWILSIVIFLAFVVGWIYYESQWQDEVVTQEIMQDSGDGGFNTFSGRMIGGDYGETGNTTDNP